MTLLSACLLCMYGYRQIFLAELFIIIRPAIVDTYEYQVYTTEYIHTYLLFKININHNQFIS
jgi:hypothetical protein